MVRVIGQDSRFNANCRNCGAELQFKKSDVRAGERVAGYDDDRKSFITCPKCHNAIDVTVTYGVSSEATYRQQERDDYDL